ncbi:MAG: DUF5018 domain-containing protein [Dysgonamonadaceae bacterium]|jgi:hypothetical protein|nr:DUF5018 domain-containing protein [Dysgonamonadaceae bacterium]
MKSFKVSLKNVATIVACFAVFMFSGCDPKDLLSGDKQIVTFGFALPPAAGVIDEAAKTIVVEVPAGTVVTALVPVITVSSGATVSPASGVSNNFTNPTTYTVTAADGSTASYVVTVNVGTGGTDPEQPSGTPQELQGTLSQSRTLKDLGFAIDYIVPSWFQVNNNAILTVEPGVCIAFQSTSAYISISGGATIKMLGTAAKTIQLRGAGNTSGTQKGSFGYLDISTNAENILQYVEFINGGKDESYGVVRLSGTLGMTNCLIDGSKGYGFTTGSSATISEFANNTIRNCEEAPVWIGHSSQAGAFDNTSVLTGNTHNYIGISYGTLETNLTIKPATVPYMFDSWNSINKTLTISAGTQIYMNTGSYISVGGDQGFLKILGTADNRVTFNPLPASTAAKGAWGHIAINTNNANVIQYADFIKGGKDNDYGAIRVSGTLGITNSKITNSKGYGISTGSSATISEFAGNIITGCEQSPVWIGHITQASAFDATSTLTGNTDDYVGISYGTMESATTIKATSVPYFFDSWNSITKGKLTIEAGATFYMNTNAYVHTSDQGLLVINGTQAAPVKFTRLPGLGYYWQEIEINEANGSKIENCIFEYGGYDYGEVVVGSDKTLTLNNVKFKDSKTYGIYINGGASVTGTNVTFENCPVNVRYYANYKWNDSATLP